MKQLKVKLVLSNLEEDVLVELVQVWYKATDKLNPYVTVMLDFSKAFDLINHHLLQDTLGKRCNLGKKATNEINEPL